MDNESMEALAKELLPESPLKVHVRRRRMEDGLLGCTSRNQYHWLGIKGQRPGFAITVSESVTCPNAVAAILAHELAHIADGWEEPDVKNTGTAGIGAAFDAMLLLPEPVTPSRTAPFDGYHGWSFVRVLCHMRARLLAKGIVPEASQFCGVNWVGLPHISVLAATLANEIGTPLTDLPSTPPPAFRALFNRAVTSYCRRHGLSATEHLCLIN